jgi:hypothetical protein
MQNEEILPTNLDSSESKKEDIAERFKNEREKWTSDIKDISLQFKNVDNIPDIQIELYSKRQVCTEYISRLYGIVFKLKKNYAAKWNKVNTELMESSDYRYSEKERAKIADEKTADSKMQLDILTSHIQFFQETVKGIDSMIFGVKHRLEAEDFRRGNK